MLFNSLLQVALQVNYSLVGADIGEGVVAVFEVFKPRSDFLLQFDLFLLSFRPIGDELRKELFGKPVVDSAFEH